MKETSETSAESQTTLTSVRIPTSDLNALRLVAETAGGSVANEIRLALQAHLGQLKSDPVFIEKVRAKRAEFDRFVSEVNAAPTRTAARRSTTRT